MSIKNFKPSITIIGAGAYGTALAISLARNEHQVILWGRNSFHINKLKTSKCNQKYLPNISFPPTLYLEKSLKKALISCRNILLAVPSYAINHILVKIKKTIQHDTRIILASKGLEPKTGRLLKDVICNTLGSDIPIAIISGPTFAKEIAIGLPTAITIASTDKNLNKDLIRLFHCNKNFRVYSNTDFIGIQLSGAVKNIIAIGAGISDGIGFGSNTRAALITRGLAEMRRLGIAMGAKSNMFMSLASLGDLILTCTDNCSRNRRFGILLGKGWNIANAKKNIGQVIEGLHNIQEIRNLSIKYSVEMPITEQIYQVLCKNKNIYQAVSELLERKQKKEI